VTSPKRLAVLTTGRQDYGILRGVLLLLARDRRFDLRLWVGGMHLRERFGRTVEHIRADGMRVARELDFVDEPPDPARDAARAAEQTVLALRQSRPDALLVVGDRHEVLGAAMAAVVERVPVAHLHGGEESEGAIDNVVRHAVTKLSHLHLVSHERHAQRVRQMGELPDSVIVVGAPGLDNRYRADLPDRAVLEIALDFKLAPPLVIVTVHPTPFDQDPTAEVAQVAAAMAAVPATYIITQPNADAGGSAIRDFWCGWSRGRAGVLMVDALGEDRYWALLKMGAVVLGNSSSGVIEAPEIGAPVVNVGERQRGRLRGRGVLDVLAEAGAITKALRQAIMPEARARVAALPPTYSEGPAAPRIVDALAAWTPPYPPRKAFRDLQ